MNRFLMRAVAGATLLVPIASSACSSCGCTLSSDWDSQGYASGSGWRFDLRFDYLNQSQLRSGTGSASADDYPLPQDREIERATINRYTTLGFDYSPNPDWGVNLQLPYVDRWHSTVPEGETTLSHSMSQGIGDVRVLVRYQGFTPAHDRGLQFGLKLPTGAHDVTFADGTEAGEPLDRGLQPGSGSTDLLLGVYRFGNLGQDWDAFANAQAQVAIATSDDYRPGNAANANVGIRYLGNDTWMPQLQLNARWSRKDSGMAADAENSGGALVDISPGVSVRLSDALHVYGFVQFPVYQRVNGLQLAPRMTASVGARYAF